MYEMNRLMMIDTRFRNSTRFLALMTVILLLAAAFRVYHIIQRPIWTDEGTTTFNLFHFNEQSSLIEGLALRDHHPPLYYWLMQAWVALTGESVLAMRYFAALMGMLSVALMVPLARQFLPEKQRISPLAPLRDAQDGWRGESDSPSLVEMRQRVGREFADAGRGKPTPLHGVLAFSYTFIPLAAALFLALSDPDIDLAQEIRFYTLRTLLVMMSAFFYFRWQRHPQSWKRGACWLLTNVALLHTNYQGGFIIFFEGLHALLFLRGSTRWRAIAWLGAAGLLFAPWFLTIGYKQGGNPQGINSTLAPTWETFTVLVQKFLGQQWPLMAGLLVLGLWNSRDNLTVIPTARKRFNWRSWDKLVFLLMWIALTLAISFVAANWFSILSPRRVMLLSPALALLVARGLARFQPNVRLFLMIVMVVYGVAVVDDYYPKAPWDKVGADLAHYADSNQAVLLEIYYDDVVMSYYADQLMPAETEVASLRMWRQFHADSYPNGVFEMLAKHETAWLVHWDKDLSAFDLLQQAGYTQTALMTTDHWGNALNVYRFDKLAADARVVEFSSGMNLLRADIKPADNRVDLWWSAAALLDKDYTVSVFLLNEAGQLVAQSDAFPFENRRPTTGWGAGEVIYDPHPLPQMAGLPEGQYTVAVQIYTYWDGAKFPPLSGGTDGGWLVLGAW